MATAPSEIRTRRDNRRLRFIPVSEDVFRREARGPIRKRRRALHEISNQTTIFTATQQTTEIDKVPRLQKRRPIVLALMRLNKAHTGPEFKSINDERLILDVYGEKNLNQDGQKSPAKIQYNRGAARLARNDFIAILEHPEDHSELVIKRAMTLVDEVRNLYPYYKDLTIPQIIGLLKRTIDFSEIIRPVTIPTEEVLPDGFVVRQRTYHPPIETKLLAANNDIKRGVERSHLPPRRRRLRQAKVIKEAEALPQWAMPQLPRPINVMTPEEIVAYSLMLVKDNGRGYRYPNAKIAMLRIYDDPIAGVDKVSERERKKIKIPSPARAAAILTSFTKKLVTSGQAEKPLTQKGRTSVPEVVQNFVNWADAEPLYLGSTPQELAAILRRHTTFEEILSGYREQEHIQIVLEASREKDSTIRLGTGASIPERDGVRLNLDEKYLLSTILANAPSEKLESMGISLSDQALRTIARVSRDFARRNKYQQRREKDVQALLRSAIGPIVNTLRELFNDPQGLLKRVRDPQTRRLLSMVTNLRPSKRDEFIRQVLFSG